MADTNTRATPVPPYTAWDDPEDPEITDTTDPNLSLEFYIDDLWSFYTDRRGARECVTTRGIMLGAKKTDKNPLSRVIYKRTAWCIAARLMFAADYKEGVRLFNAMYTPSGCKHVEHLVCRPAASWCVISVVWHVHSHVLLRRSIHWRTSPR